MSAPHRAIGASTGVRLDDLRRAERSAWLAYEAAMSVLVDVPTDSPRLELERRRVASTRSTLAATIRDLDAARPEAAAS
jgi:hypothetical protein